MEKLKLDDFYKYRFLSNLTYNPSGTAAVVTAAKCDTENNGYAFDLYLVKDGNVKPLTADGKVKKRIWEDDTHILFAADRSDAEKKRRESGDMFTAFYRLDINGGEAMPAFTLPVGVMSIQNIKGDLWAVTAGIDVNYPDFYKADAKERSEIGRFYKAESDYEVIDESPFWFNGVGMMNKKREALFVTNVKTGETERITPAKSRVSCLDTDGENIYYAAEEYDGVLSNMHKIYSYSVRTKETKPLCDERYSVSGIFCVGEKLVVTATDQKKYGMSEADKFYTLSKDGGKLELLYDTEQGVGNSVGSDCRLGGASSVRVDGTDLYFVSTTVNSAYLYKLSADGVCVPVVTKEGSVDDFDVKNGKIILTGLYGMKLQELYAFDGELKQLSDFNTEVLKGVYVAKPEKMTVKSCGWDIDGWVLKPYGYDETKKYPAVLDIHGGPKTAYGEVFYHEMQAWANMGYFVFFCNPYGSDGKGNEFGDLRGKYGTVDYQNIMDFTDTVLEKYPQIDREKVAVTGGSYGGFMTNWIIGHTDRFACAATQRSISNWVSFYGISDIGIVFGKDQNARDIFTPEGVEKMWEQSPLKYVRNMKTPTLFIHSDCDYRCPIAEGYQLYTALKDKGVDTRMCVFHGENHELSRGGKPLHRLRRLSEITDWIVKYTK